MRWGACNTRRRASLLVSHHKDFHFVVVVLSTSVYPTEFEHFFVCLSGNLQLSKATSVECLPGTPPLPPQVSRGCWRCWRPPPGKRRKDGLCGSPARFRLQMDLLRHPPQVFARAGSAQGRCVSSFETSCQAISQSCTVLLSFPPRPRQCWA